MERGFGAITLTMSSPSILEKSRTFLLLLHSWKVDDCCPKTDARCSYWNRGHNAAAAAAAAAGAIEINMRAEITLGPRGIPITDQPMMK